jgi:PAS domain S-box-containing protein
MTLIYNTTTGKKIAQSHPSGREIAYDGRMMIVEMDNERRITYTNRPFREVMAYSREELIGLSYESSLHPDMPEWICEQAFDTADSGSVWLGYAKTITKEGAHFWSAVCLQPKYDVSQQRIGYIVRKKGTDAVMLEKVKQEFAALRREESLRQSEYCGALYDLQGV